MELTLRETHDGWEALNREKGIRIEAEDRSTALQAFDEEWERQRELALPENKHHFD